MYYKKIDAVLKVHTIRSRTMDFPIKHPQKFNLRQ